MEVFEKGLGRLLGRVFCLVFGEVGETGLREVFERVFGVRFFGKVVEKGFREVCGKGVCCFVW